MSIPTPRMPTMQPNKQGPPLVRFVPYDWRTMSNKGTRRKLHRLNASMMPGRFPKQTRIKNQLFFSYSVESMDWMESVVVRFRPQKLVFSFMIIVSWMIIVFTFNALNARKSFAFCCSFTWIKWSTFGINLAMVSVLEIDFCNNVSTWSTTMVDCCFISHATNNTMQKMYFIWWPPFPLMSKV